MQTLLEKSPQEELKIIVTQLEAHKKALDQFAIVAETDAQGRITYVNDNFCEIAKYSRQELIGKDHRDVVNSKYHPPSFWKEFWQTISQGKVWRGDIKNRAKDGSIYWVDTTIVPFIGTDGRPEKYLAIRAVITERKEAEDQLRVISATYARSLIEASLDPLFTMSLGGKITENNQAMSDATGFSRDELIGSDFFSFFTEPQKARESHQLVLSIGTLKDYPLVIQHKDGKLTNVLYNASLYKDINGKVLGVFAAARDITLQKKAEEEVDHQRSKELERLAELERFQKLTVGRELKMIELKKENEELKIKLGIL